MCGDSPAAAFCGIDHKANFFFRKRRSGLVVEPPTIIGVDLDPIGSMSDLVANDANDVIPRNFFSALRNRPFGGETFWPVAAGRDDSAGYDEHPRAWTDSLIHRLLQPDVGIRGA